MPVLIDGFNLIYKFPELEELMYLNCLEQARKGLLDILKDYQRIKKTQIMVIFDGKKQPSENLKSEKIGTIDVYYSLDYSADYLIKEFTKKNHNPRMITVITSDKDITLFVKRFKAKVIKSEAFAEHIKKTIEESEKESLKEKEENPEITDEDISYWEKVFKSKKK